MNITSEGRNTTAGGDIDYTTHSEIKTLLVTVISVSIVVYDVMIIKVLSKCKRIAVQINSLFISYVVCDTLLMLVVSIHSVAILVSGRDARLYKHLFTSRIISITLLIPVSWATVAAISLERLLALTMNVKYAKYITTRNIWVSISTIWAVNLTVPLVIGLTYINDACNWDADNCDMYKAMKPLRLFVAAALILYKTFIVVAYIKISSILRQHVIRMRRELPNINASPIRILRLVKQRTAHVLKATRHVLNIAILFVVLHVPLLLNATLFEFAPGLMSDRWQQNIQLLSFICVSTNSFVTSFIYVWNIKECRLQLYLLLECCSRACHDQAESCRIEIYDIERVSRTTSRKRMSTCTKSGQRHESCM